MASFFICYVFRRVLCFSLRDMAAVNIYMQLNIHNSKSNIQHIKISVLFHHQCYRRHRYSIPFFQTGGLVVAVAAIAALAQPGVPFDVAVVAAAVACSPFFFPSKAVAAVAAFQSLQVAGEPAEYSLHHLCYHSFQTVGRGHYCSGSYCPVGW